MNISIDKKIQKLQELNELLNSNNITKDEFDDLKNQLLTGTMEQTDTITKTAEYEEIREQVEIKKQLFQTGNKNQENKINTNVLYVQRIKAAGESIRIIYRCIVQQIIVVLIYGFIYGFVNGYYGALMNNHYTDTVYNDYKTASSYLPILNIVSVIIEIILSIQIISSLSKAAKNLSNVDIPLLVP